MTNRSAADPVALLAFEDPELLLDAVTVTDAEGTITAVNRAFTRLHGYLPEQVIGRRPRVLSSGLHPRSATAALWRTLAAGEVWAGELIDRCADGSLRTVRTRIVPIRDPGGRVSHYVAIQRAVSRERTATRGQLRLTADGRCTYADPDAAALLHPDGDPVALLGPGLVATLDLDDAAALREVVEQTRVTARPHRIDLVGHAGYVRCTVELDAGSSEHTEGPVVQVSCGPVPEVSAEV